MLNWRQPRTDEPLEQTSTTAPRLGEHADEILTEAGWALPEISALRDEGVVL